MTNCQTKWIGNWNPTTIDCFKNGEIKNGLFVPNCNNCDIPKLELVTPCNVYYFIPMLLERFGPPEKLKQLRRVKNKQYWGTLLRIIKSNPNATTTQITKLFKKTHVGAQFAIYQALDRCEELGYVTCTLTKRKNHIVRIWKYVRGLDEKANCCSGDSILVHV